MKTIVVGLGVQGNKRKLHCGNDFEFSVDPNNPEAEFSDLEKIDYSSFESVMLCVPDELKEKYVNQFIARGKNILIEKPFTLTSEKSQELLTLATNKGLTIYVAYNHRFEPNIVSTRKLIQLGEIGKIFKINLFYGNGTAELVRKSDWRDQGLGVISDLGSHLLDLVDYLVGLQNYTLEIISANRFENKSYDNAMLKLVGDPEIILEVSLLSWRNSFRAEIVGEEGSIHLDSLCKWGPSLLTKRKRLRPSGKPKEEITKVVSADPTWEAEYFHFKSLVKSKNVGNLENNLRISTYLDFVKKVL
jgi:scyllo-inositol 2-dehydrogenase (NADP+)